ESDSIGVGYQSFNPRPRVEGDLHVHLTVVEIDSFNPRPRVEGDPPPCNPHNGRHLRSHFREPAPSVSATCLISRLDFRK
ncbi:MAG TPA: hypothetical protein PKI05_01765, partial [Thermogutta sp.]|nr:hypothetical protein [Thermogutta sp.]